MIKFANNLRALKPLNTTHGALTLQKLRPITSKRHIHPPSHFGSKTAPPEFNEIANQTYTPTYEPVVEQERHQYRDERPIKEMTSLLAMVALGYFAIDNYLNRIKLEKLNNETTAINLKTLQIQQANFVQDRRKKDLQLLQERKEHQRLTSKLSVHIALLRKQLIESGIDPVNVEEALKSFERSVKIDNSIKNITGQNLWVDEASGLKGFLTDIHEYEKRGK